ncbi:hypothetical protein ColTof4_04888 [Colletotrichum tofieldiae]|nr:hypothetical protein ColTof3_10866 [Colletotrichum tofieldiae]GKT72465.1 hypothetical protein ColTof4_04888 [Colletotrichum tofieldiae]
MKMRSASSDKPVVARVVRLDRSGDAKPPQPHRQQISTIQWNVGAGLMLLIETKTRPPPADMQSERRRLPVCRRTGQERQTAEKNDWTASNPYTPPTANGLALRR